MLVLVVFFHLKPLFFQTAKYVLEFSIYCAAIA